MAQPLPLFYVFHGGDEFGRSQALDRFKTQLGPPDMIDLNTTVLDKPNTSLADLRRACDATPFLAEKRLVIVRNLLTRLTPRKGRSLTESQKAYRRALCEYLPTLPETTRLVFVDEGVLPSRHPVVKLAKEHERGYLKRFDLPADSEALVRWIHKRVRGLGGEIDPDAARHLGEIIEQGLHGPGKTQQGGAGVATHRGLRLLDQEIGKLVTYTNRERPITEADIEMLVSYAKEALIWDLVDAVGLRDKKSAAQRLHTLLDADKHPLYLLTMIIRQFRLLIQVKDLESHGASRQEVTQTLHLHPFPSRKLHDQARRFTGNQLEAIYHYLLETDVAIKTGEIEATLALDLLINGLCL